MKYLILGTLLFTVSCGKYVVGTGSSVGTSKIFKIEAVTSKDLSDFTQICSVLPSNLTQYNGIQFTYNAVQNDCGEAETDINSAPVVTAQIQDAYFKRVDNGLNFLFPEVDTPSVGALAAICANLSNLKSPILFSSGDAQWFTTQGINNSDCPSVVGETCVKLETGSPQNDKFLIHTTEWVRFRTDRNQAKVGFYTYRKKVSRSFCKDPDVVTLKAQLK